MKVTNIEKGPRGLNTKSGQVLVEPGQTVDVDMDDAEVKVSKGTGWFEFGAAAAKANALKAEHHGGGRFNVTQGEEVLVGGLSKADADSFNAMSDEDKRAYIEKNKA